MKKAQILSAIALAFALGVVAPVAGVNTASAVEVTTPADKVSATDLKAAIAKAEGYANYKNYQVLLTASNASQTTYVDINVAELLNGKASDADDDGINGAIAALDNTYIGSKVATTLDAALTKAKATETKEDYSNYKALYDAINNKGNQPSFATLSALAKAAGNFDVTLDEGEEEDTNALIEKIEEQPTYVAYANLIQAVKTVEDAQKKQSDNIDALKTALKAWGAQTNAIIDEAATKDAPVAALVALAAPALTDKKVESDGAMVTLVSLYATLATEIGDAKTAANGTNEVANAAALKDMETAFYKATGVVLSTVATPTTPTNPEQPGTTTPADPSTPAADDPSAPGTGIVSTAEGNAATTVSIVAGLATALTALGAGVVAYRSARRSNK